MREYRHVSPDELRLEQMASPQLVGTFVTNTHRGTPLPRIDKRDPMWNVASLVLTDTLRANGGAPLPHDLIHLIYAYADGSNEYKRQCRRVVASLD